MDKTLILNSIKSFLGFEKDSDFAKFLGIKQNTLSTWKSRNTIDYDLIISKCDKIDANWLLTGEGSMLKVDTKTNISQTITGDSNIQSGNNTSITGDCKEKVQELQKLLNEKDKEIERQKKQIDKLFNMIP